MNGKNLQILVEPICGAVFCVQLCSVRALPKQKEERPDPLTASPVDSSGDVTQDDRNEQLKQINTSITSSEILRPEVGSA